MLGGRYRSQPRDPVTGKRMNLAGRSLHEIEHRIEKVRTVKASLHFGDITMRQAGAELRPTVGMNLTVAYVWQRYVRGVSKQSEIIAATIWRHRLAPYFAEASLWDLSETRMREWLADLERHKLPSGKRGYSPSSKRAAWDFLRGAVMLAHRDGLISELPWGKFTVPDPKHPETERESTRDQVELLGLLQTARVIDDERARDWCDGIFAKIAFFGLTGLRQAEACGLSWSDIDLEREPRMMRIRRQAIPAWPRLEGQSKRPTTRPKNGPRDQQLHPNVEELLRARRALLQARGHYKEDGPVWPSAGGGKWRTTGQLMKPGAFRKIIKRSGLPNVERWVLHSMRHSFARLELIGHGGDLRSVGVRTGHHDLATLEGYLRNTSRDAGSSRIPSLPLTMGPPALEAHADQGGQYPLEARALEAPSAPSTAIVVRGASEKENATHAAGDAAAPATWVDDARVWLEAGGRGKRPPRVTSEIKAAYARAYKRALRDQPGAIGQARLAASRARRAALGAWGKSLNIARARRNS